MAEKNRVYELAKHYSLTSKQLLEVLQELGIVAKSHMSLLEEDDAKLLEKHFAKHDAAAAVDKAQRVEVEKAKPKQKRLSAKEKLAQKRAEREAAKKSGEAEPEAKPAAPKPAPRKKLPTVKMPEMKPVASESAQPASQTSSEGATAPKPERKRSAPKPKVDLDAIARAAAQTTSRIVDDMKTRQAEPQALPQPRPKRGERKEQAAPAGEGDHQPRPIDPSAIRNSVRKALGRLDVSRSERQPMPQHLKPRKRPAKRAREDKRDRVARHRAREEAAAAEQKKIRLTEFISVQELAQKLEVQASELIMKLMGLGVMATMNQRLDREQIELLIADYEVDYQWLDTTAGEDIEIEEEEGEETSRPAVVTVMGHVDHGKTTLLDYLRKTNVTAGEAGGITQHIGAYQVTTDRGVISFLDTPGHEAFTAMRARGAKVTDIVVVVVAADDKVMPQTEEAISHARASDCPIIIAINKIDLPAADPAAVKQQLTQHNVVVEEYGGDVQAIEISAKKGINIDALLEAIQLQAELLDLRAVASGHAVGTVLEAHKDPGRGVVFTVLVTRGTLSVGDPFVVGQTSGRVRAMLDEHEQPVKQAGPSRPVVILGCDEVPGAGDTFNVMPSEREAKEVAAKRRQLQREQALHAPKRALTLENLSDRMREAEQIELPVIIKGDVAGSIEAISDNLLNLSNEKVAIRVLHAGVGAINENDITLAESSSALIIGFHLRPTPAIKAFAKEHNVELRLYDIIYEVVGEVKAAMKGMLAPVEREVATGSAEVREIFRIPKIGVIAGSFVIEGVIKRNSRVRVIRDQVQVYESTVSSLKRFKEDAREVKNGFECGIGVDKFQDIKVGDILEVYEIVEEAAEL